MPLIVEAGVMQSEIPFLRELIQAAHGVGYHVTDHETREALERQTQSAGTQSFLDCLDRALHLPNMTVGGDNNQNNGQHGGAHALELVVIVDIAHGQPSRSIVVLSRSGTDGVMRKPTPWEIVWKKECPVQKKKSAQRVTF